MKNIIYAVVLLSLAGLAGCVSGNRMGINPTDGLPEKQYMVGIGYMISYIAPQDGTAFLVEKTAGRILMTKSLRQNEQIECTPEQFRQYIDLPSSDFLIQLYFVPSGKAAVKPAAETNSSSWR